MDARIIPFTTARIFRETPVGGCVPVRCMMHPREAYGVYRAVGDYAIRGVKGLPQSVFVWDAARDQWACDPRDPLACAFTSAAAPTEKPLDAWPDDTPIAWAAPVCYCGR